MPSILRFAQRAETKAPEPVEAPQPDVVAHAETEGWEALGAFVKRTWPKGFSVRDGKFCMAVEDPDTGVIRNVPFSDSIFYGDRLIWTEDDEYALLMESQFNGQKHGFVMPLADVASLDKVATVLASQSIFLYGKIGRSAAVQAIQAFVQATKLSNRVIHTVKAYGWDADQKSFIIGKIRTDGKTDTEVQMGQLATSGGMAIDFGKAGTKQEWVSCVDEVYNRPGAEPYQFAFLVAAASPLIALAAIPNFHGIPVAYTGQGGRGKTTACTIACSMWGRGELFKRSSNPDGATINSMLGRVGVFRNLPIVLDELTGYEAKEIGGMLFALSNGQSKDRLTSSGTFANAGITWDLFSFMTGNLDIAGILGNLETQRSDAVSVRCFEIPVPDDINETVFKGVNVKEIVDLRLAKNYGVVGRELIAAYIKNHGKIVNQIHKTRQKFTPNTADETRERYYMDLIAFSMVAGQVMQKLGLIKFDLEAINKWAIANVKQLRNRRKDKNYSEEEYIGQFINSLHDKTIRTKHIHDGRMGKTEVPMHEPKLPPEVRIAIEDKKMFVSVKAMRDWCKENDVSYQGLRDMLDKRGYMVHAKGEAPASKMFYIGAGTTRSTGASRCFELDYNRVNRGFKLETEGNVTSIINDSVANPVAEEPVAA